MFPLTHIHTPAESMLPQPLDGRWDHCAHMELVKEQIGAPGQTPGAGHRGAHHSSVTRAPASVALCLWLCTQTITTNQD